MIAADAARPPRAVGSMIRRRVRAFPPALLPALAAVALMVLWAAHNGGFDADTWYWGALVLLSLTAATVIVLGRRRRRLTRAGVVAMIALGSFLVWSYLSMAWADVPGWALEGSNRTLLFALIFTLFLVLPWTARSALNALLLFVLGIGVIAFVALVRMASGDHVQQLAIDGRLVFPTGYFNATVALFMMSALLATALASRRELPGLLRALLITIATASLQLCVMGQSRGWLFTVPVVALCSIAVVSDRLRVVAAAVVPIVATLVPVHSLLHAFPGQASSTLGHSASTAAHASLRICAVVFVVGTLIAWGETLVRLPQISRTARRAIGTGIAVLVVLMTGAGAAAATHGDPIGFVKRQWHGFIHTSRGTGTGSHFGAVGSGRYDFWRVSLKALAAHPLGGLGQDNFADYYVRRRRTGEEPLWTHSLEMRLFAHTGLVGFALFAAFLGAAFAAVLPALRRGAGPARAVVGMGLLPLVVWLVHGSVDWFWEFPALSGPALGFLGMAVAFGTDTASVTRPQAAADAPRRAVPRVLAYGAGALAFVAATFVLAFPYLSVRETSIASNIRQANPNGALERLATAADLNPFSPDPTRLAGTIALDTDQFTIAQSRFRETTKREPGGWFGWLGAGLAASALGERDRAYRDFYVAASINSQVYAIHQALVSVYTNHPLTAAEAFRLLATG